MRLPQNVPRKQRTVFSLLFFKQDNSAGVTENEDLRPEILTETFKRQANLNEKKAKPLLPR